MLTKCNVCGMILESAAQPSGCPRCEAPAEQMQLISHEKTERFYNAERSNDIHAQIISLCVQIAELAEEGIKINLDPGCFGAFDKAINDAWIIKQRCKAEIASHVEKESF